MCKLCRLAGKELTDKNINKMAAPPLPSRTVRRSVLPSQQPAKPAPEPSRTQRTAPTPPLAPTRTTPTRTAPTRTTAPRKPTQPTIRKTEPSRTQRVEPSRTQRTKTEPSRTQRTEPSRRAPTPKGRGGGGKGRKGKPFPPNQCENTLETLQDLFEDGYTKVQWNLSPGACRVCSEVQKNWTLEEFIEQTKVFDGKPAPMWGLTHPRCVCTILITSPDKDKPMVILDWKGINLR